MNLDLNGYRLHLVFSLTDMRSGYRTLSAIASSCLQLDVAGDGFDWKPWNFR